MQLTLLLQNAVNIIILINDNFFREIFQIRKDHGNTCNKHA